MGGLGLSGGKEKLWELGVLLEGGSAPPSWNIKPSWGRKGGILLPLHLGEGFETQAAAGYKEILSGNPSPFFGSQLRKTQAQGTLIQEGNFKGGSSPVNAAFHGAPGLPAPEQGHFYVLPVQGTPWGQGWSWENTSQPPLPVPGDEVSASPHVPHPVPSWVPPG